MKSSLPIIWTAITSAITPVSCPREGDDVEATELPENSPVSTQKSRPFFGRSQPNQQAQTQPQQDIQQPLSATDSFKDTPKISVLSEVTNSSTSNKKQPGGHGNAEPTAFVELPPTQKRSRAQQREAIKEAMANMLEEQLGWKRRKPKPQSATAPSEDAHKLMPALPALPKSRRMAIRLMCILGRARIAVLQAFERIITKLTGLICLIIASML